MLPRIDHLMTAVYVIRPRLSKSSIRGDVITFPTGPVSGPLPVTIRSDLKAPRCAVLFRPGSDRKLFLHRSVADAADKGPGDGS